MTVFKVITSVFVALFGIGLAWGGIDSEEKGTRFGCFALDAVLLMALIAMWGEQIFF